MKKTLLFIILSFIAITSFAQQGEIIYRENVALIPNTYANITPDSCMLFWYATIPTEPQDLYLDVDLDNVADFWVHGSMEPPTAYIFAIHSRDWEIPTSPLGWRIARLKFQNTDTISSFSTWGSTWAEWPPYLMDSPAYDTTMMLRYGLRNAIEDSVGNVTNYYGWIEVEGHWTHTYVNPKVPYSDTLTACISRLAYCTVPNYPLRWGQTSFDYNVEENDETRLTLHPNPTNSIVNIVGENISTIEVINIIGQTILKSDFNSETITVDLSGQPAGIYFFTIIDKKGNKCTRKVIKE